jgi:phytoene dehydrogenase-like protein
MKQKRIVIIGGGIAGLCAAVYGRKCGYAVEVLEMGQTAGGLATSWRRGDYTFETCLHWLVGSNPQSRMYARWHEIFDIDKLQFIDPVEYLRVESPRGETLSICTGIHRMERELLAAAPQDAREIRHLISEIRRLARVPIPDLAVPLTAILRALPALPVLRELSGISIAEYGRRFRHPLLRGFFGEGDMAQMSALALVFSLAWMSDRNAGYAIGGSQAIIRQIVESLHKLGGNLRLGAKVDEILVEHDTAAGVRLQNGETIPADWVISAADGHATIYDLLGGRYVDPRTENLFRTFTPFPSYLQVSLGIARDLSDQPAFVTRMLETPLTVDPGTELSQIAFRFFHFDPTFAPPGKTPVTCFLPTRNVKYWTALECSPDVTDYEAEKHRVAEAVIGVLETRLPGIRQAIEVVDVSTPATVIRYTGNWQGSMEGWLPTPGTGFRPLRKTLPGLERFLMVGQWVMPGGGLPSGMMTARAAIRDVCRKDGVPFLPKSVWSKAA